ncbi:MAG TPA: alpha/beta hydrolase-fold protein [Steroidobacteraceae bacterium]|jgi:putative esterase|nr:alpha/beta hydrolase-fold protein [Steroidobacteraceae bacterium]
MKAMLRYALLFACLAVAPTQAATFSVTLAPEHAREPLDGRLLLLLSVDPSKEPRFQIEEGTKSQQVFGIDASGWKGGESLVFDSKAVGYPRVSLADVPAGTYRVQALLHRYETFRRKDGHVVQLPMDRGEGQAWSKAPGNLYSAVREIKVDPAEQKPIALVLDQIIAPIKPPADTEWVKHERIKSRLLSEFWGRPMYLGAHVLLPQGWAEHPKARYPLMINHGHFPEDFDGFRTEEPDANLAPDYSDRFRLKGYNRLQQQLAHQLYKDWTSPGFPRVLAIEIQHANPYYDDSYAVNSENLGPYADAIQQELIPYLERKYRALGSGWARFVYGGSTGGWEALAVQVKYPDFYNGAFAACPDPIDFRAYGSVNVYEDRNAYAVDAAFKQTPRIAMRDYLGRPVATLEEVNRLEFVLGPNSRSGGQWDIWQAVFSPVGADGYPKPIWNKRTGEIDRSVASYWRENYDLVHIMQRDWEKGLGEKLRGKIHLYVGELDNYYLENAVYLAQEFLESTRNPKFEGVIDYGRRAEHCWNGDHTRPNAESRLRYHQMFIPIAVERMRKTAPAGADLDSWNY